MRRLALLVLLVALAAPTALAAEAPDGFLESWRLTPRAVKIAVVPATRVYCATSSGAWESFVREQLRLAEWQKATAIGMADPASDEVWLAPQVCRTLENHLRGRKTAPRALARHLFALTHEAMHVRGIRDEHRADCAALKRYPFAAREFGIRNPARVAQLRQTLVGRTLCS